MRWWAGLVLGGMIACGNSPEPQPKAEVAPQPLEIPPLDAGAATSTLVATPLPASKSAELPFRQRDEFDDARDPIVKSKSRTRDSIVAEETLGEKLLATTPPGLAREATLKRLGDLNFRLSTLLVDVNDGSELRKNAIKYFTELLQAAPTIPKLDEAQYYLGLAYEQNGDFKNARKAYYEVIRTAPTSNYVPYAYFGFGEMFRHEGESDPSRNELAEQAYREAMKYPQSAIAPFAKRRNDALPKP